MIEDNGFCLSIAQQQNCTTATGGCSNILLNMQADNENMFHTSDYTVFLLSTSGSDRPISQV